MVGRMAVGSLFLVYSFGGVGARAALMKEAASWGLEGICGF